MKAKQAWLLVLALALVLGTAWAFSGFAQDADDDPAVPDDPPGMMGMMGMMDQPDFQKDLGLTEEQQTKLRALGFDAAKNGLRAGTEMQIRRMELEELLQQDTPDSAAVEKSINALAAAQTAMLRQHVQQRLAFHNVFTPEQRAKLRQRMMMMHRQHMRSRWFGREGGEGRMFRREGPGFGPGCGEGFGPGEGMGRRRSFAPGQGLQPPAPPAPPAPQDQ